MNTATVANLLGVSQSTLKRWIKELGLDMNRNDLGHFDFIKEDIYVLKHIQKQIQNGTLLHDIVVSRNKVRKGKASNHTIDPATETLLKKINELEKKLNEKADKVVSYQLLNHRKEIEDLENEVKQLHTRVEDLERRLEEKNKSKAPDNLLIIDKVEKSNKARKKNLITMLFGF